MPRAPDDLVERLRRMQEPLRRMQEPLRRMQEPLHLQESREVGRVLMIYVGLGLIVGVAAIVFHITVEAFEQALLVQIGGYDPGRAGGEVPMFDTEALALRRPALLVLPAIGALAAGLLVHRFAPEATGAGLDAVISAYHRGALMRRRVMWVKTLASALVLGSGGSAGREGPVAQVGAAVGSVMAKGLKLSRQERHVLCAAGAAAGIGAVFHAPIAAALLMAEVVYKEMELEHEVIVPGLIASIVAYSIYTIKFAWNPLFVVAGYRFQSPVELVPYLALALCLALAARAFVAFFVGVRTRFSASRAPPWLRPAIGGLGVGVIGALIPATMGSGYGVIQNMIDGHLEIGLLAALAVGKILTTSLTVGSGGSGGLFAPSMVIGGVVGGVVGMLSIGMVPSLGMQSGAFIVIGMAGFFSAVSQAPLATIILVTEMTGNYHLLVPAMWVCVIAFLLTKDVSLFASQRLTRMDSREHLSEALDAATQRVTVAAVMNNIEHEAVMTVRPDTPLVELRELYAHSHHATFPVVDEEGRLLGMIDDGMLRGLLAEPDLDFAVVAADLVTQQPTLTPDEPLRRALDKLVDSHHEELAVVDAEDRERIVGMLSRRDVVAFMEERVQEVLGPS